MSKEVCGATVYLAVARYHPITEDFLFVHVEVSATVNGEFVELDERPFVKENVDPLAGRQLADFVLAIDTILPPPPNSASA